MECIEGEGLDTSLEGDNALVVGSAAQAPRIVFYLTAGEAEAAQFRGEGEGSEQIGSALLRAQAARTISRRSSTA